MKQSRRVFRVTDPSPRSFPGMISISRPQSSIFGLFSLGLILVRVELEISAVLFSLVSDMMRVFRRSVQFKAQVFSPCRLPTLSGKAIHRILFQCMLIYPISLLVRYFQPRHNVYRVYHFQVICSQSLV